MTTLKCGEEKIMLGNIYGPRTDVEKSLFLNQLNKIVKPHIENETDGNILLFGDINIVKNNLIDNVSGNPHSENIVKKLNSTLNELHLHDIWRLNNPNKKVYTWCRKNPFIARRLDYIFASTSLLSNCFDTEIKNIGFSDHKTCSFVLDFTGFRKGPSTYKMNTELLRQKDFIDIIKRKISDTLVEADMHLINPHYTWELIKAEIRAESMLFSKNMAKNKNYEKSELTKKLSILEEQVTIQPQNKDILDSIIEIKKKLEIFSINESRGAQIRAGIKFAEEGEKITNFFLIWKNKDPKTTQFLL